MTAVVKKTPENKQTCFGNLQQGLELHGFWVHKNSVLLTCVSAKSVYLKAVNLKTLERAENVFENENLIENVSLVFRFYSQFIVGKTNETLSISGGAVGPGLFFIIPCMDQIVVTDLRTVSFDVPPQEILTKDSVTVAVDAVVYFKISNPMAAVCNVNNAPQATKLLASTTLRNTLGTKTLSEMLADREQIAGHMLESLDLATDPWGVKV